MNYEKLKVGYSFIRVWRALAYVAMISGCLAALVWGSISLVRGIGAFYSLGTLKDTARTTQKAHEEQCEARIKQAQTDFQQYEATLPQRLERIKKVHQEAYERACNQYRNNTEQYSDAVSAKAKKYNSSVPTAEEELKRYKNINSNDIAALAIPVQAIRNRNELAEYRRIVQEKASLISEYRSKVQNSILSLYAEYEAPLLASISEKKQQIADLERKIQEVKNDYENRISKLERTRRSIPENQYGVRPSKNIYGINNEHELERVLDSADLLPIISARLEAKQPLTESLQIQLRQKILNLSDWLPSYIPTYSPTDQEIEEIRTHNQAIDNQIYKYRTEMRDLIAPFSREIQTHKSELSNLERRKESMDATKEQLTKLTCTTTENWEICRYMSELQSSVNLEFPVEPRFEEPNLQAEKDKVNRRKQELQTLTEEMKQEIARSREALTKAIDEICAKERTACAVVLTPGISTSCFILASTWFIFWVLLILGNYMICPLVTASKLQELTQLTKDKENK